MLKRKVKQIKRIESDTIVREFASLHRTVRTSLPDRVTSEPK